MHNRFTVIDNRPTSLFILSGQKSKRPQSCRYLIGPPRHWRLGVEGMSTLAEHVEQNAVEFEVRFGVEERFNGRVEKETGRRGPDNRAFNRLNYRYDQLN